MIGLALAAVEILLLHSWLPAWWWLILAPLAALGVVVLVENRQLRAALADAALQREEAAAQLDRRISELFSLRELSHILSDSLDPDHIVEQITGYAARFLQAEGAIVVLSEPGDPTLTAVAARGSLAALRGVASSGEASLVQAAVDRGRVEVAQDLGGEEVVVFGDVTARAAAVIPLSLRGEPMGAIAVTDRRGGPFTTEDLWLLSTVATNASVAIANGRLFAIVERGRKEWETAFNALQEGIAVISPAGAIQRANSSLARIAGVEEADLIGCDFRRTIFGRSDAAAKLIESARGGEATVPVLVQPEAGGRFLRLAMAPLHAGDGAIVVLVEDVTQQRALEAQLFQNEKMAAIGQLVSGVAHELNNPLTSIAGLSEFLLEQAPATDASRHLRVIHEQAERAGRIVRNLLTFVRKGTPEQAPADLNDIVRRTVSLAAYQMKLREVEFESRLLPEPVVVLGDQHELQQVLLNLLTNAGQAVAELPRGRRRMVVVETRRQDGCAMLVVRDSGNGVPAEFVPNLFTPFFTTKAAGDGTGLGLSLSYGLVQAHGGSLSYAEAAGGGAEFTVALPEARNAGPASPAIGDLAAPVLVERRRARRILLVDSDPGAHRLVAALFAPDGYQVDTARGGDQALAMAATDDYDLIIADVAVTAPSGGSFLEALIEADPKWSDRLVAIGAANGDGPNSRRISKPFDLRRLRSIADELMR